MPNKIEIPMDNNSNSRVFVWDIPVRLFHWTLVLLMIALIVTGRFLDGAIEQHAVIGKAVVALVLFRIMWGVVGSTYARFSQFIRGPQVVLSYAKSLLSNKDGFCVGHNPLGGWMVLALLAAVLLQATLGLFANDDILFDGPFAYLISKESSDYITGLHATLFDTLLILIGLHVAAIIWHKVFKGEGLLAAMFNGYKELPDGMQAESASGGGVALAVFLLVINVAIIFLFV
jgi:cytochrome b